MQHGVGQQGIRHVERPGRQSWWRHAGSHRRHEAIVQTPSTSPAHASQVCDDGAWQIPGPTAPARPFTELLHVFRERCLLEPNWGMKYMALGAVCCRC